MYFKPLHQMTNTLLFHDSWKPQSRSKWCKQNGTGRTRKGERDLERLKEKNKVDILSIFSLYSGENDTQGREFR